MNPNYVYTITIFHNENGAWSSTVLQNCFWKSGIVVSQSGTEASQANTYTVRVPERVAGADFAAAVDDIVVLGECKDRITGKSPDTAAEVLRRNKPEAFRVTVYSDNTSHLMDKHYRLGG